jgi:hypothetical protein
MRDRIVLGLAVLGTLACVGVHGAAYLGHPATFGATVGLMGGAALVWGHAIKRAREAFKTINARSLWTAVVRVCPWLTPAFYLLVLYFAIHWARMLYVVGVEGDRTIRPGPWALFASAGAAAFYVGSSAFLLASRRADQSVRKGR